MPNEKSSFREGKQERREFIKGLGKFTLPLLSLLGLNTLCVKLQGNLKMNLEKKVSLGSISCEHGCASGCEGTCKGNCSGACTGDSSGSCADNRTAGSNT